MSGTTDTRELILQRILDIASSIKVDAEIAEVVRNRGLMKNEKRPAIILLDADELPRLSIDTRRIHGRAALMAPQIVQMRPELYILPKEDRPTNDTTGENIGTTVNAFRIAFMKALWEDTQLATLLGSNGSIVYYGMATDLKSGSPLSGQMRLDFAIMYVLRPTA